MLSSATYTGSGVVDGTTRRFDLGMPVIKIWDAAGTTLARDITFDNAINQPIYTDGPDWLPDADQAITIAASGKLWRHCNRLRFRATLEFIIPHPAFAPKSVQRPPITGFTELDLTALENAIATKCKLEFYPHATGASSFSTTYEAYIEIVKSARDGTMWQHAVALAITGVNTTTSRPTEF